MFKHPASAEDYPGLPGLMHDAADMMIQAVVGGVVGYWTKSPYAGKAASDLLGPLVADAIEYIALDWANMPSVTSGGITFPDVYSPITSTTGTLSPRGNGKKQIRSTSHYYSRRRKRYEYGKKRRY